MQPNIFPERLKSARKTNKLTQKEVARHLNVHQSTYAGYEIGARKPSIDKLVVITELMGVESDWLIGAV